MNPTKHPTTQTNRHPRLWGYAGVYPGEFGIYQGDVLLNRLRFQVEHGFSGTGIGLGELQDPERTAEVCRFIRDNDLKMSLHPSVQVMNPDRAQVRAQVEEALGRISVLKEEANLVLVTLGAGRVHRFLRDPGFGQQMEWLREGLTPLAAGCAELGLPIGIENHGDYYISDLVELCRSVPHLGIFLDTGNCFLAGERPIEACAEAVPYVVGTHFKDHLVAPNPRELKFEIRGATFGEGDVGLETIYRDLVARHPNPEEIYMQFELVPDRSIHPLESLRLSKRFVERISGFPFRYPDAAN